MKLVAAAAFVTLQACVALAQDVVFIGEFHDNPAHHETQASRVASLAPAALVFEMLTEEQAAGATPDLRNAEDELRAALDWDAGGWPDFTMYYPILAAAPSARIYGAGVTRDAARQAMQDGFGGLMDDEAAAYGLDHPLPDDQQAVREALQMESHCNALPEDMLSGMVRQSL